MSLTEYLRKRAFERTPEPKGAPAPAAQMRFFVQRHKARRLHYDLRLEYGGVLKSWAVPKGPTLDPAEKRLAVLVEDHPLEYGDFEGTIPAGNYGAGTVMVWDRGTYEWLGERSPEEQWQRGDLKFRLHGQKLMGEFALVRMKNRGKGNEWLLLKKKDFAARPGWDSEDDLRSVHPGPLDVQQVPGAIQAPVPEKIAPMLATSSATLPQGPDWLYEVKWDGVRVLCYWQQGRARLLSRKQRSLDRQFPEFSDLSESLNADSAVLDGEIVALDEAGRPSFAALQPRIMASPGAADRLARVNPATLFAFDLLYLNGFDLRRAPLVDRKRLLAAILRPGALRYSEHFAGQGNELLEAVRQSELEGVVAKRASSPYESRRSPEWVKVKVQNWMDFVLCGFTEGERKPFSALVLGGYEDGKLRWVGNVGSGFTEEVLQALHKQMKPLMTARCPLAKGGKDVGAAHWLRPQLVCTVRFASWTGEQRLRAPVFLGIRPDVDPSDCRLGTEPVPAALPTRKVRAPFLQPGGRSEEMRTVDGRRLKFTNLGKVFYPQENYTKRDVINYYEAVADLLLPYLQGRPLSLKRYPNGIEGEHFFQKEAAANFPSWLRIEPVSSGEGKKKTRFVLAEDRASLLYLANLGCIDQNPMMSRVGSIDRPDFILLDLDPWECAYDRIVEAAQLVRQKLELLELAGYPKTTGGDGMHIYVPIDPRYSFQQARSLAEILARLLAGERPDLFTTPRSVARREKGKVYFDYLQIGEGKTISAPYVLRAYPGAPVSTPLAWSEVVPGLTPRQFHLGNVLDRFDRVGDLFQPVLSARQELEKALGKMEDMVRSATAR